MAFGKIWTYPNNIRVHRVQIIAKMNGLELEFPEFTMRETNTTEEFKAKFPLGKVPAFESADGLCLSESIAIATYAARSGPAANQLLGADPKTEALISQWVSFAECEIWNGVFPPLAMSVMKFMPLDEQRFDSCISATERCFKRLEVALQGGKKYLVGDKLTMADLFVTSMFWFSFKYIVDAEMRKELPNVVAYAKSFAEKPEFKELYGELEMCETRLKA
ncbi:glutathione S-transferase [Xylariaceae sp. FL1019]|nr:glutathione S-transferase [Xylariaceae sp. FL1019]